MKRFSLLVLAALMTVACAHMELTAPAPEQEQAPEVEQEKIFVSIEDESTRVQLNSKVQTTWTRGDQVVIVGPSKSLSYWQYNGNTGARSGELTCMARYIYNSDPKLTQYYAMYPLKHYLGWGTYGSTPILFMTVPSVQNYVKDSYGVDSNFMIAVSDNDVEYKFKNMSSYLRISLVGSKKVDSIVLSGNNGDILSGEFYFLTTSVFEHRWNGASGKELILDCGDGVQLGSTPVTFHFALMPTTFSKGITITVNFTDGTQFSKSTSREIVLGRNELLPMATIDTDNLNVKVIEVEHTANTFVPPVIYGGTSLTGYIYWGDGSQTSLTNAAATHVYWDNQPSHTVVIKSDGANSVEFPSLKGVNEINFSNF